MLNIFIHALHGFPMFPRMGKHRLHNTLNFQLAK